tara:strand:- start:1697 stop:2581 length:885 start_codon:yes stop_codon:yes gene_type:complete
MVRLALRIRNWLAGESVRTSETITGPPTNVPELGWREKTLDDPDGGKIVLWPHLPCVRMPHGLRSRRVWDGVAFLLSHNDISMMKEEEKQDRASPGVHNEAAMASGTTLGRLVRELEGLDIEGPKIPDPEQIRHILHAENSRGGLPVFPIEPDLDDAEWSDWLERSAEKQVNVATLLSTLTLGRRWSRNSSSAISKILPDKEVGVDLGAAAAACAAWWLEEEWVLGDSLYSERDLRFASRIRGAMADLRDSRVDDEKAQEPTLMVPVHQARLPSIEAAISRWPMPEALQKEEQK